MSHKTNKATPVTKKRQFSKTKENEMDRMYASQFEQSITSYIDEELAKYENLKFTYISKKKL